jgi:hypothetical protein
METFIDVVGWWGASLILAAYALLSLSKVSSASWSYQGLNLFGAVGLATNSYWKGALPSAALNLIWLGIAVYALLKLWRHRSRRC